MCLGPLVKLGVIENAAFLCVVLMLLERTIPLLNLELANSRYMLYFFVKSFLGFSVLSQGTVV